MFIMIDGIDGSGKGTIIEAWKKYLTDESNAIFDLKNYWQKQNKYPEVDEIKSYDFIFSAEPTYAGIGQVIRDELIKNGRGYSAEAIAQAFSLDRLVLYKKILVPLLTQERLIIQDRGVSSSLAYQSTQHEELSLSNLSELPGNKFAIEHRPDHLVLMDIKPETAIERLSQRTEEQDDSIFEKLDFLKKLDRTYRSDDFQNIFTARGTQIHWLSAEEKIDIMREGAVRLLKEILQK